MSSSRKFYRYFTLLHVYIMEYLTSKFILRPDGHKAEPRWFYLLVDNEVELSNCFSIIIIIIIIIYFIIIYKEMFLECHWSVSVQLIPNRNAKICNNCKNR